MKKFLHLLMVAFLVFIDQLTKNLILGSDIANGNSLPIIDGVFRLSFVKNSGAVWGIFGGKTTFLLILAAFIMAGLIWCYVKTPDTKHFLPIRIAIIMIAAGAIGNIIDRVRFKYVIDFLDFELINFPVFNVADCYITIAVFMTAALVLFYYKDQDLEHYSFKKKDAVSENDAEVK